MILTPREYLEIYEGKGRLTTGIKELNEILDGGFVRGRHVQIHGLPGTAKTYLCITIALHVLQTEPSARIIWIDTVGCFPTPLLRNLCQEPDILKRFLVVRSFTLESLLADLHEMMPYEVPLVVVDHIAAPFRILWTESITERIQYIRETGRAFRKLGLRRATLFLYINQSTTRFVDRDATLRPGTTTERRPTLLPALGENWAIFCDVDIRMECNFQTQRRKLTVVRVDYDEEHKLGVGLDFRITV